MPEDRNMERALRSRAKRRLTISKAKLSKAVFAGAQLEPALGAFTEDDGTLSRTTGSVVLQVGALELLARYSMNSRATSVLSSLHEFRSQEVEQTGGKQWNWKYLRQIQWRSTYLSMAMYILRITLPIFSFWKRFYDPLKKKWFWMPMLVTFLLTLDLVVSDISVVIYSSIEGMPIRPAFPTMSLLSVYIFLPMRNNFLAIFLGVIVSVIYIFVFAFFTYNENPNVKTMVACEIMYLIGVNLMGTYFRLMNEIVTRRSFLDRRACVESTLRLKFVKDQEERLMLSILPEHIVSRVRHDIRDMFLDIRSQSQSHNMKSFSQLYVEEHNNVSILYADVVNYTKISTTLSPMRMVELLNELFGRFDEASEEHDVLRIKFLGDCYYCVSGIPKPTVQHAKNCVDLGLEMIHIIKDVRDKRSLNIDMRIGVHSGKILSGLIGIRKWQFDVWSKDVTIANKMESTGKAGKVHVTKQTLELLLDYAREYIIEPNFSSQSDPFIIKNKLETFLLTRPPKPPADSKPFRRASVGFNKIITSRSRARRSENNRRSSSNFRRTTAFMDENLVEYQQMLKAADAQMAKEIEDMTNGNLGLAASSMVNVIGCAEVEVGSTDVVLSNCISPWQAFIKCVILFQHVTQCWSLALLLNFLFSRVFFIFKWIVAGGMTIFYLCVVWEIKTSLFARDLTWNVGLDPRVSHTLSVVFITVMLYWIDRTTEYRNRLDYLWQIQLREEQEEAETMLKVNNMLLENILPAHVVQVYLDLNRSLDELYYEKYDNVAVMFASLTDYKLGLEDDADLCDKFVLSILDEVISDFDRLLLTGSSVYKIEKIKMAGWTYMAACGLDPNRRDSYDSSSYTSIVDRNKNTPYNRAIVVTMVEFAAAMMMQLQNFNRGSFQSFEGWNLRIGISNGEVAAGVVGSLKPLYDIWGNAVNMASRMDSTGETGRIQVTENTAIILDECGILTSYRGETFVKGRGYIKTYFVPLDENFNLVKKENSSEYFKNDERQRYFYARPTMLSLTSVDTGTLDTVSQNSTTDIQDIPTDVQNGDVNKLDENNCVSFKKLKRSISDYGTDGISIPPRDDGSDVYAEMDIIETRC
ncbi:adenylate cyclase type 2 like protein [Danaus plexippus plexippus]|uniref:adenylate cyclase n=1 Tax=Danaus plexippus plexippus TaxID=278856 RepID=A0A212EL88_DANPL|nr:adenylate cyclase type 2 like protein [Danaus plexippus plexippus]